MTASKPAYRISSGPEKSNKATLKKADLAPAVRVLVMCAVTLYPVWFTIHYRAVYDPDIWWHLRDDFEGDSAILIGTLLPRFARHAVVTL
jgi:hypothetical protein